VATLSDNYFGGTPTAAYAKYREKSFLESMAEQILGPFAPNGKSFGDRVGEFTGVPQITRGVEDFNTRRRELERQENIRKQTARSAGKLDEFKPLGWAEMGMQAATQPIFETLGRRAGGEVGEIVESAVIWGMEKAEQVWSHAIARPMSTASIMLGDVLDGGEFKATPRDAWNRSAQVSYGQAYVDATVGPIVALQEAFGIESPVLNDWDLDIWSDADIARAQQENNAYSTVTGTMDALLNLAPLPVGKGVSATARAAGLSKTAKSSKFAKMYDRAMDGIDARQPKGTPTQVVDEDGVVTTVFKSDGKVADNPWETVDVDKAEKVPTANALADEAIRLSQTNDVARIMESPLVKRQYGVDPLKLSNLIAKTNDPKTIVRIHLATLGDVKAAGKLFEKMPAEAWQLSGVSDVIKKAEPGTYIPVNEKMDLAFYESMDDWDKALYENFITDGGFAAQGNKTMAMGVGTVSGKIANVIENRAVRAADKRVAVKTGDFDNYWSRKTKFDADGNIEYRTALVGREGANTQLLDFSPFWRSRRVQNRTHRSFSQKPLNMFSYARTRPDDIVNEFYAMVADSPVLRPGAMVSDLSGKQMTMAEWVNKSANKLADAASRSTGELKGAFQEIQREMVYQIGRSKGLTDPQINDFLEGYQSVETNFMGEVRANGKFVDSETGKIIQFDGETIRELANSELTIPLQELSQYMEMKLPTVDPSVGAVVSSGATFAGKAGQEAFDFGAKFFRTGMLLKPGYILRNAAFEPGITAVIAHMDTAPGLMIKDTAKGTVNWFHNRLAVNVPKIARSLTPSGKRALKTASQRYRVALQTRDRLIAELDAIELGEVPPSVRGNATVIEAQIYKVNQMLTNVLESIADIDPNISAELIRAVDYEYTSRVARGSSRILKGDDAPLAEIQREISEWERMLNEVGEPSETDLAYLDRLAQQQDIYEAVVAARDSGKARLTRKASTETGTRGADMNANKAVLKNVTSLLDRFSNRALERAYLPDSLDETAMDALIAATRDVRDAAQKVRGAQSNYAKRQAKRDAIEQRRKRTGEKVKTIKTNTGQELQYEGPFRGPVGNAYREDASGHVTALQNFAPMGGESMLHRMAMQRAKRIEFGVVSPTDANYFNELHYYATRKYARESTVAPAFSPLAREVRVQQIIDNVSKNPVYRKEMGLKNKADVEEFANETVDAVDDMFPSQAAKDLISGGEDFGVGELAEALLSDPNVVLRPIEGQASKLLNRGAINVIRTATNGALDKVWSAIAVAPEAALGRWPYYARQHELLWTKKMNDLAEQAPDAKITLGEQNAAQLYAHRESLKELEKVFYTIRRYNRTIFTSRFLQTFPGAWANGLYRYLYYLPKNYPAPVTVALLTGKDYLDRMLYGEDGEPADYWDEDAHIILNKAPGVGPLIGAGNKLLTGRENDIKLGKDSYTRIFADIPPSRSYLMAAGVDSLLQYGPESLRNRGLYNEADALQGGQERLKSFLEEYTGDEDFMGISQLTNAAVFGDFGTTRNFIFDGPLGILVGSLTPGHFRSAAAWLAKESSEDWQRIANYQLQKEFSEREQNEDDSPVKFDADVAPRVNDWYAVRFWEQFLSPAMGVVPMPNYPGQVYRDGWRQIGEENPEMEFEEKMALMEERFPDVDPKALVPFTKSTSKNTYNVAPTLSAFSEVERFPEAARKIAESDPAYVGLLAMDQDTAWGDSSQLIYQVMKSDAPFAGGEPYRQTISPREYQSELQKGKGWDEFSATDSYLDAKEEAARDAGDKDALKRIREVRREWLHGAEDSMRTRHPEWYQAYIDPAANRAEKTSAIIETNIIGDTKVWARKSQDPAWQLLDQFLKNRRYVRTKRLNQSDREKKYKYDEIMLETYGPLMQEYPMTKDLWDTVYEPEYLREEAE